MKLTLENFEALTDEYTVNAGECCLMLLYSKADEEAAQDINEEYGTQIIEVPEGTLRDGWLLVDIELDRLLMPHELVS